MPPGRTSRRSFAPFPYVHTRNSWLWIYADLVHNAVISRLGIVDASMPPERYIYTHDEKMELTRYISGGRCTSCYIIDESTTWSWYQTPLSIHIFDTLHIYISTYFKDLVVYIWKDMSQKKKEYLTGSNVLELITFWVVEQQTRLLMEDRIL